jgi:hypothetical protein
MTTIERINLCRLVPCWTKIAYFDQTRNLLDRFAPLQRDGADPCSTDAPRCGNLPRTMGKLRGREEKSVALQCAPRARNPSGEKLRSDSKVRAEQPPVRDMIDARWILPRLSRLLHQSKFVQKISLRAAGAAHQNPRAQPY